MVFAGMALLLAAGCQRNDRDGLVLLTPGGALRAAVQAAVAEFEREHPGVRVRVVSTPGKDYYVKSLTMLAGRAPVDVLWMGQGFGVFAGRGALRDLTPLMQRDAEFDLSAYLPQVVDWYRQGNGLYGIPSGIETTVIAYNQDLFDAAGEPYPAPDWTVEDMLAAAERLTRFDPHSRRIQVAGLGMKNLGYQYYGLDLLTGDHRRFALNTEAGREHLRQNVELIGKRILQKGGEFESLDRLAGFLSGRVAMMDVTASNIAELHDRVLFRWDVVAMPIGKTGKRLGWASSSGYCIARNSKHPELAWELLKKLTDARLQKEKAALAITIPTITALHEDYLKAHPAPPAHVGEVLKMLDHMQPSPRIAAFQEAEGEWGYWRDLALLQKIPVEKALNEAESHINRILDLQAGEGVQ